jgi:chemotaxis response regulator CheB
MTTTIDIDGDLFLNLTEHPVVEAMCPRMDTKLRSVGKRAGT